MQFSLNKPAKLGQTKLVLIDGPAGAGKTTLAQELAKEWDAKVIHLEFLYNGWDDAITSTLTKNLLALCNSIREGITHSLPIYSWEQKKYDGYQLIEPTDILIIEGVGAGQSAIREFASALIWVDADPEISLQRVMERDGYLYPEEISRWKVREAEHFKVEQTAKFADFHYLTS